MRNLLFFFLIICFALIESGAKLDKCGGLCSLSCLQEILHKVEESFSKLSGYSCIGYKKIYKDGRYLPEEKIFMEVTINPRKIYLKWLDGSKKGQEVFWPAGAKDKRLVVKLAGPLGFFKKKLEPNSRLAMKDTLHPIDKIGFKYIIEIMNEQIDLAKRYKIKLSCWFRKTKDGYCLEVLLPKDKFDKFYCYKVRLYLYNNFLPHKVLAWQKIGATNELKLVEQYEYSKLKLKFLSAIKTKKYGKVVENEETGEKNGGQLEL